MSAEEYIKAYTRGCSNELVGGGYHEWLTPENALAAVELAREEMREQMMKDAIECHIDYYDGPILDFTQKQLDDALEKNGAKTGDKVKVIIIKE